MSKIIPNTFQTPNAHVDQAMHYLTGDQYKVLNYAVRHVYGWHNRPERYQGRIALSVFVDGFTTDDGQRYLGCGLGRNTVIQILDLLVSFGLLTKAGDPTADGQKWGIGTNPNWDLIIDEYKKREAPNLARVQKMNEAKARKKGGVSSDETGIVARQKQVSSHDTGRGSSDDTHIKPSSRHAENQEKEKDSSVASAPEITSSDSHKNPDIAPSAVSSPDVTTHSLQGKPEKSATAEKAHEAGEETNNPTPNPLPLPAPVAAVDAHVKPVKQRKPSVKQEENNALVAALGEAWGGPIASSDYGLYVKQATALVQDVPIEEFKAYCDFRKAQAGDWASRLTIAQLLGKGHVSEYLKQRNKKAEDERKQRELEEKVFAQYPEARPRDPNEPIEYAPKDEVLAMMSKLLNPTRQENVS